MRIRDILVRQIFDSRGEPTIAVRLTDQAGAMHEAAVPSGKSRGSREAAVTPPDKAIALASAVATAFRDRELSTVGEIDAVLLGIDPTPTKTVLGGNVTLGVSVAACRALAAERNLPVWQLLRTEFFPHVAESRPAVFSNFINGGSHAKNNLDVQEYLIVARPETSYAALTSELIALFRQLGERLARERALAVVPIGDEDGYSLDFPDNAAPLRILHELLNGAKADSRMMLGLDVAASSFFKQGRYSVQGNDLTSQSFADVLDGFFATTPFLGSVEDPFAEDDLEGFHGVLMRHPEAWVVGDDLTVTNSRRIEEVAERGCINAVIIKPNQVGTVSETCEAVNTARRHGAKIIVSHRSGETDDTFIIDLARAAAADGVKIGAPMNERMGKFDALIRLYD